MEEYASKVLDMRRLQEIAEIEEYAWRVYYSAIEYVKCGFFVIPLVANGKALPPKDYKVTYANASNNTRVIRRWFHPEEGRFAGWNIGIATGREGGCFVIDVDRHGDEDGIANMRALEEAHGQLPIGPSQKTPNGGYHYLFRWQENATSSTNKIAPGVDTRGGDVNTCRGHIVAFPSKVNGKQYEWVSSGPLPMIPEWVMDKMGVAWKPKSDRPKYASGAGRGNENVTVDDFEKTVPEDQVIRMLDSIDPDDLSYEEWYRVGMAIKSQYPGPEGLKMWDDWSKDGYRYKKGECDIRWNGFSEEGTVRMGTLFYMAKERGWEPQEDDVKMGRIQAEIERVNSEYAFTIVGGKARILRERKKTHESENHMASYELMTKDSFEAFLENDKVTVDEETGKKISIAKIWLASVSRRTYPNGIGLFPEGAPPGYYNTWEGFSVKPIKGKCELFINHIKEIICNNNPVEYEWVLDWMADLVQNPADPKGTAIVMRSGEGTGKGTVANTLGSLLGSHYMHLIDDAHLTSNFNAHLIDALLVFADEITWGGNKKTAGKLKGIVTERHIIAERKGVDAQSFRNLMRLIVASNEGWVIPAGVDSRRWYVTDVSEKYKGNMKYFDALRNELNNGGREALLYYLLNREIKSDLRIAPHTEALQEQRDRSTLLESFPAWISSIVMSGVRSPDVMSQDSFWPEMVLKGDLYNEYEEWCRTRNKHPDHSSIFFKKIKELGFGSKRITHPNGKERPYAIIMPEQDKIAEALKQRYGVRTDEENE